MSDTNGTAQLAAVLGSDQSPFVLTIRGEAQKFPVGPFEGWQMLAVLKCIDALSDAGVITNDVGGTLYQQFNQYKMFTRGGDHAFRMLAVAVTPDEDEEAIDKTAALLRKAKVVDLLKLLGRVYKVNKDFFVQSQAEVLALFGVTVEQVTKAKEAFHSIRSLLNLYLAASPSAKSAATPWPKLPPFGPSTNEETAPS